MTGSEAYECHECGATRYAGYHQPSSADEQGTTGWDSTPRRGRWEASAAGLREWVWERLNMAKVTAAHDADDFADEPAVYTYYSEPDFGTLLSITTMLERADYIYPESDVRRPGRDGDKGALLGTRWMLTSAGIRWLLQGA